MRRECDNRCYLDCGVCAQRPPDDDEPEPVICARDGCTRPATCHWWVVLPGDEVAGVCSEECYAEVSGDPRTVSERCREDGYQACQVCEDVACGDNTSEAARCSV